MENNYHETRKYRCLVENEHFLSEELYLTMCGVEACLPGKGFGPVVREGYHLHVIISGRGCLEVEGCHTELHAGQMFIEKPGEMTFYHADLEAPWAYCWMTFRGSRAAALVKTIGFEDGLNSIDCNIDPMRFYRVAERLLSHPEPTLSACFRRYSLLNEYIALMLESASAGQKNRSNPLLRGGADYMDYARDYIRLNYAAISVADVASHLGISRSHLARLFKKNMDCSPNDYLKYMRMVRGAWLLTNTGLSIQEVSSSVGYEDQLTFSKAFKKVYGVSPKYYREMPPEDRRVLKGIGNTTDGDGDIET